MHTTLFDWNPIICKQLQKFIYFLPPSQVLYSQYPGWKCTIAFQWWSVQYCQCDRRRQAEVRGSCLLATKFFHFDHWSDQKSGLSPPPWKLKNGCWALSGATRSLPLKPPGAFPWKKFLTSPLTVTVFHWQCHVILQPVCNTASWRSGQRYGQQPRCTWFESLDRLIIFTW